MQERISREQLDQAFDARFPEEMQTKLRNARVAVAGLGGLGSNIAVMLARSGVGELLLVDFDTVDVTNLNRQMYLIPQLGKPKAEALPEILYQINPYLTYRSVCIKVTPDNVKELFSEYPIVCEAFDKPDQKAMLVRELLMQCPKTTVVSGNGMAGYADANEIRTCQVMKRLYVCGDQSTDVGNGIGLIAPRVAVCAAHEANKVLQLIMQTES
ncbi:sulfur carrier protein ThiS adenylyltransferase ThiF [Clostridiaceae bacterium AF42-6]|nr:sulfur carrier protein ThiS adenylyltransferase ThiF [Clostridiaceae bacterium AF42-6]RHP52246.1 sulfur carrier protein ThiS adenylyltransferase ThiF [Clostridiaceae bacterium AF31-3BH]RHQ25138.1 sulfur carrier protein ThiS adenylyltransferase ThiF [Clostridiaceae bacterium AF29-16BH]